MEQQSLKERMLRAGIYEVDDKTIPLAGEDVRSIFQGVERLTGTGYPSWLLDDWLWENLEKYQGSKFDERDCAYDALIEGLFEAEEDPEDLTGENVNRMAYHLLIEPFCLIARAREVNEAKESGRSGNEERGS